MNETHATKYLEGLPRTAPSATAERERRLLAALGDPQKKVFLIKIIGEAGKSSASSLLASLLRQGKISTGTVSLTPTADPRRAIQIAKEPPAHKDFAAALTRAWNAARELGLTDPTYEEMLLATALTLFAETRCRVAIVLLNAAASSAASALAAPALCLFTACSKEKAAQLVPLIDTAQDLVSAPLEPSIYRLLTERAATTHCRLSFPTKNDVGEAIVGNGGLRFTYRGTTFSLPTLALYQKGNALAVIEAYRALVRQGFRLTETHLHDALSELSAPFCFHLFSLSPLWLIDAADSPLRLTALAESLAALPQGSDSPFTVWTEPHLADEAKMALGEYAGKVVPLEKDTLRRTLKNIKPPKDTPLLVVGEKAFVRQAKRILSDLFL